jgi:hypothetical protein
MKLAHPTFCGLLAIATAACSPSSNPSPGAISPERAASHIGQTVRLKALSSEVHTARSGSATFIDMGGHYPNNAFAESFFSSDMASVGT